MNQTPLLRILSFITLVGSFMITPCVAQRMSQDSWYLKKTVETGIFAGGIASDNDGNIYVSDAKLGLIKKFSPSFQLLQTWGGLGTGDGQFGTISFQPTVRFKNWFHIGASGMCFTAAQELVVCDPANHRVQVFSRSGSFLRKFGTQGSGEGQFNAPVAAAVSADNKIYVADRDNHRVQVFSSTGAFLLKFGQQGGFDGQLLRPAGVAMTPAGEVVVADSGNKRIQTFTPAGIYLRKLSDNPAYQLTAWRDGLLGKGHFGGCSVLGGDTGWTKDLAVSSSKVRAWGYNGSGQTDVPTDLGSVVGISAGGGVTTALCEDGTLKTWGQGGPGQTTPPADLGTVVSVAVGGNHTLALQSDGRVIAWGYNSQGQTNVPTDLLPIVSVAAGGQFSLAVQTDGKVRAWGYNVGGQTNVPADLGPVVAVAAGMYHSVALQADGKVRAWGQSGSKIAVPTDLGPVVAVAANQSVSVALQADGKVRVWGETIYGMTTVPANLGPVVAVATGCNSSHIVVLQADGKVRAWGDSSDGKTTIPTDLTSVLAIAAGQRHTVVLQGSSEGLSPAHPFALTNGDLLIANESGKLSHYARTFRTILPESPNAIPLPVVISTTQRPGTGLVDIDFRVDDVDDATVQVAALAFKNGGTSLADVIPIKTLVEGAANKLGVSVATGQVHRITWDARADVTGDFEQVKVEILAKDARGLFNLDFIQIPTVGAQAALKISKTPLKDADFFPLWLQLITANDPEIVFDNGSVYEAGEIPKVRGLEGQYFGSWDFAGETATKIDEAFSFSEPSGNGTDGIPFGFFSIRWTGEWLPEVSGNYIFDFGIDDVVNIWIGGQKLVTDNGPNPFTVSATAGVAQPIRIEYDDRGGGWRSFALNITPPGGAQRAVSGGDFRCAVATRYAHDAVTTEQGRRFLLARSGYREATAAEVLRAQEAGTPGVINQWTPPLQVGPGERPLKVNAYGFETGDTGTWVVPVTP